MNNPFTYISLFSSAGVGCFGFKNQDFHCIATNEINNKRLAIQKYNNKCDRTEGYICGDIKQSDIKQKILYEIDWWKKHKKIKDVDVIIATPPCQGMSVANHKKKENEIDRNSLIFHSIQLINEILPKFFVFENVQTFLKTLCYVNEQTVMLISEAIEKYLGDKYTINAEVINFKNFGANSSRNRTLVIGVRKDHSGFISPLELFPERVNEKSLKEVIGNLKPLNTMGEIDESDVFHFYRTFPEYMLNWIRNLKEGESSFNNANEFERPYKIKNNKRIPNVNKNGGKYTRLFWDKCAPLIHTRNDQLASQNTIHPRDNRVLSIRELMLLMNVPDTFVWALENITTLNPNEKKSFLKKNEMVIRQSLGEAVPTIIFEQIAKKIKCYLLEPKISDKGIIEIINEKKLDDFENLKNFIIQNNISNTMLSRVIELANNKRDENAAFFTGKKTINSIFGFLPEINKSTIRILEPSVGCGNFLPFLFSKYAYAEKIIVDVVDIDSNIMGILKLMNQKIGLPKNVEINYITDDFIKHTFSSHYDLIIGNPPFKKLKHSEDLKAYREICRLTNEKNFITFFLEKAKTLADRIVFILPKSFLNHAEYNYVRKSIKKYRIEFIIDFGEKAFTGVNIETICIGFNTTKRPNKTIIHSFLSNKQLIQKQNYFSDSSLPTWVIYRNEEFDLILETKQMGAFDVYRDRYLSKKNTHSEGDIWILQARNISRENQELIHIDNYDRYLHNNEISELSCYKYLNMPNVYLVPNMTYYPRMLSKPPNTLINGTVALLIPKQDYLITNSDIDFICSEKFERFYRIAMNHSTRTLNIDSSTIYYYCINK